MIITQQPQNRHNIARFKTEKGTSSRGIKPVTLHFTSDSSGFVFPAYPVPCVVAEWWNVCIGTLSSGGPFSSVLNRPRPTTHAPFAQIILAPLLGLQHFATVPVYVCKNFHLFVSWASIYWNSVTQTRGMSHGLVVIGATG